MIMKKCNKIPKSSDSFELVIGMLSHLKGNKTSVELQHEATQLWTDNYIKETRSRKKIKELATFKYILFPRILKKVNK